MKEIVIGKDRVSISELIGKGGEGEVYGIKNRSGQAVKIYNTNLRNIREDKVRAMVADGLAVKTDIVAYPGEVVTDAHGNFLGFAMRLMSGYRPLHELYSPKSRQRHFPKADYRFIVHAALNVARAIGNAQQMGCIIGDLNHSGVLVAQNATVALIDADSFQFTLKGKTYPCLVGVPDFTPPELHGKNLASIQRTIEHDNFGLAVAIFHLLFMGRHPYAGRYKGPDISMDDAIAQNRFAFSLARQNATQTSPPPGALTLDLLPNLIASSFERAFGTIPSARPSAQEWITALNVLEGSLNHCSKVKVHYYPKNAKSCVWCKLTSASGFDMFPDMNPVEMDISNDELGTEQAIQEIFAFPMPTIANLLPTIAASNIASNSLYKAKRQKRKQALNGLLMMAGSVAGFIYASRIGIMWFGLAIWGWITFAARNIEYGPFLKAFDDADKNVQSNLSAFVQRNGIIEVIKVRDDLDLVIKSYRSHTGALDNELKLMKSNRESRQRQAYLDRFSIYHANISGIGQAKTATLISFGIETAADINRSDILRVPGFGDVMTSKLLAWRREHESNFKYDPKPNSQDFTDEKKLRTRYALEKVKLETTIRNGLGALRNARNILNTLPAKVKSDRALMESLAVRAQAEQDLRELGVSVPVSSVSLRILITKPVQSRATGTLNTPDCPRCNSQMQRRSGKYGQFWGCSKYPRCNGIRKI